MRWNRLSQFNVVERPLCNATECRNEGDILLCFPFVDQDKTDVRSGLCLDVFVSLIGDAFLSSPRTGIRFINSNCSLGMSQTS